jgi:hypothetical protein
MSLDLNKLENKLDEALSNETSESLNKFLNDKRMTNNKQQTAVEWLVCQLQQTRDWQRVINEANQSTTSVRNVLQQAKEMDKERLKDAYRDGKANEMDISHPLSLTKEISANEWYKETYGGGNQ